MTFLFSLNTLKATRQSAYTAFLFATSVGLITGLLTLSVTPTICWAKRSAKSTVSVGAKSFLPPVASINPDQVDPNNAISEVEDDMEPVGLAAVASPTVKVKPRLDKLDTPLAVKANTDQAASIITLQQQLEETELETLWTATVQNNPVIRFSLEKLAMPVDLQPKHSSRFLTKSLSALISGASLGASMLPGGGLYRNMGAMAAGDIARNLLNKPIEGELLTATEKIQLATLVDELKNRLIQLYRDYRTTLVSLDESSKLVNHANRQYGKAMASKDELAMMTTGANYYKVLMDETRLKNKAKLYRMELERLATPEVVSGLQLALMTDANQTTVAVVPTSIAPLQAQETTPEEAVKTDDETYTLMAQPVPHTPAASPEKNAAPSEVKPSPSVKPAVTTSPSPAPAVKPAAVKPAAVKPAPATATKPTAPPLLSSPNTTVKPAVATKQPATTVKPTEPVSTASAPTDSRKTQPVLKTAATSPMAQAKLQPKNIAADTPQLIAPYAVDGFTQKMTRPMNGSH